MSTQAQEPFVDDLEDGGDDIDPPLRPADEDGVEGAPRKDEGDWLGDADEDTRKWFQSKGWKSPADMAKSAREAESALGRERAARTKAESDAAELVQMMQNAQVPNGRGADDDPYQIEQLGALMEAGEVTASQAFKYLTSEVVPDLIRKEAASMIQPVAGRVEQRDLRDTAAELEATYPDFRELSSEVISLMRAEPSEYAGSRGMKRAYAMVKADHDAKAAREARNTQRTETLDRGSIGSSIEDSASAIRERIRGAGSRFSDGIG